MALGFLFFALDTIFRAIHYGYLASPGWQRNIAQWVGLTVFLGGVGAASLLVRGPLLKPVLAIGGLAVLAVVGTRVVLVAALPD